MSAEISRTFPGELKRLREEAGLSLSALARRVSYSKSYVADLENGRRRPNRRLVRELDGVLDAGGQLQTLFDQRNSGDLDIWWPESFAAIRDAAGWLWTALDGGGPGDAVPGLTQTGDARGIVLRWLVSPVGAETVRARGERKIGRSEVIRLHGVRTRIKEIDNAWGGRTAMPMAMAFLRSEAAPMLNSRYDEVTGRELLAAVAEITLDLGWMAYDAGRHGLARRCFFRALRLSRAGGDTLLGGRILAGLSHQALHLGQISEAVDFVNAACAGSEQTAAPRTVAMLASMAACAQAARGERALCEAALGRAEQALGRGEHGDPRAADFDEGGLWGHAARCYRDLRQPATAAQLAERAVQLCREGHDRTRAQRIAIQAAAHVQLGDAELAAELGLRILDNAREVRSEHVVKEVASLARDLQARGAGSEFQERAREYMTHSSVGPA